MAKMNKYDREHLRRLSLYQARIDAIFDTHAREAAAIGQTIGTLPEGALFSFDDYPLTRDRVNRLLSGLRNDVLTCIVNGIDSEWTLANNKNNELARMVFGSAVGRLPQAAYRRYFSTNDAAREAFKARQVAGLSLSDRVWNYTTQFKSEIELGLDIGIRSGQSAAEMTKELRNYLRHPDKLFRRVRDEHGILQLSKAAAAFHPGQGVYRSSYKNARRLAATETNIAYRTSDHERWQQMDFVVGIEIQLSNNHTCLGADGKPHEFYDICDELKGRYPKDFKFTGWHPHCRCHAVSILKTEKEIAEDTQRILDGEPVTGDSVNRVDDVPQEFKDWLANNEQRVKYQSSVPYFLRDNPKYVHDGFIQSIGTLRRDKDAGIITDLIDSLLKVKDPTYVTEREVKTMIIDFAKVNPQMFNGGLSAVSITRTGNSGMMANSRSYFRGSGKYDIKAGNVIKIANHDFSVSSGVFNPLHELKSAMRAISEKRKLTFNEEYALESLWHEIRHAMAVGWTDIRNKTDELVMAMETINQFCARRSYGKLVKALGGKQSNMKAIIEDGYGYHRWVRNFCAILKRYNISQSSAYAYFNDRIVNTPYEDIREEVIEFLVKRGGLKRKTAEDLVAGLRLSEKAFDLLVTGA